MCERVKRAEATDEQDLGYPGEAAKLEEILTRAGTRKEKRPYGKQLSWQDSQRNYQFLPTEGVIVRNDTLDELEELAEGLTMGNLILG